METAVSYGCKKVGDDLSPAGGLAIATVLAHALKVEKDEDLVGAMRAVLEVLEQGRGLRAV